MGGQPAACAQTQRSGSLDQAPSLPLDLPDPLEFCLVFLGLREAPHSLCLCLWADFPWGTRSSVPGGVSTPDGGVRALHPALTYLSLCGAVDPQVRSGQDGHASLSVPVDAAGAPPNS